MFARQVAARLQRAAVALERRCTGANHDALELCQQPAGVPSGHHRLHAAAWQQGAASAEPRQQAEAAVESSAEGRPPSASEPRPQQPGRPRPLGLKHPSGQHHAGHWQPRQHQQQPPPQQSSTPELDQRMMELIRGGEPGKACVSFDEHFNRARGAAGGGTAAAGAPRPPLPSLAAWRLYFDALGLCHAAPPLIASRMYSMADAGVKPQTFAYAVLVRRCSEAGLGRMAYAKVAEMRERGVPRTANCIMHAIHACLVSRELGYAKRLFDNLSLGQEASLADPQSLVTGPQRVAYGKLLLRGIKEMAKTGRFSQAFELADEVAARGLRVPGFLLSELLGQAVAAHRPDATLSLVQRLAATEQHFKMSLDSEDKVSRPVKVEEGVLLEVLELAANKADVRLAEAAWALLTRSLALPNAPDFPRAPEGHQSDEEGDGGEAMVAAPPSTEAAAPVDPTLQVPCVPAYHALIHTYARAGDFRAVFSAVAELEAAHPGLASAVSYHSGLAMVLDALARSTQRIDDAYFILEERVKEGLPVSAAAMNVVVAACSQVDDLDRGFETFDQYEPLGLAPDADSYNALMQGCVASGMVDTARQVHGRMAAAGVEPNAHSHHLLVDAAVVAADVPAMTEALRELGEAGHTPKAWLLERCVARCERAGDREAMKPLLEQLFGGDYRVIGLDAKRKRWWTEGGMAALTGSSRYVTRDDVLSKKDASRLRPRGRSLPG